MIFILKKLSFIIKGHIKILKSDRKYIYNVTKDLFQINTVQLNFLFIK